MNPLTVSVSDELPTTVRQALIGLANRSSCYSVEAFELVFRSFFKSRAHLRVESSEVFDPAKLDAPQICWRFHDFAFHELGTQSAEILHGWGLRSTLDIGQVVCELHLEKLIEQDVPPAREFENVFDFESEFQRDLGVIRLRNSHPRTGFSWTIGQLLLLTSFVALLINAFFQLRLRDVGFFCDGFFVACNWKRNGQICFTRARRRTMVYEDLGRGFCHVRRGDFGC